MTRFDRHVFVFGSNTAGRHGKGAALTAVEQHGAVRGRGEGLQGDAYAIPTKDGRFNPMPILPLSKIGLSVARFVDFAEDHSCLRFNVTAIGCGLAGYTPLEIAPLFDEVVERNLRNVYLPEVFAALLDYRRISF